MFYITFPSNNLKIRWIFDMLLRYQCKGYIYIFLLLMFYFASTFLSYLQNKVSSFQIKKMYIDLSGIYIFILSKFLELLTNPCYCRTILRKEDEGQI